MDSRLTQKLEEARQSLLDLTMRNRLLNYRPTKARSLRVLGIDPRAVFDILVNQQKAIVVRGRVDLAGLFADTPVEQPPGLLIPFSELVVPSGNVAADAPYEPERLAKRLRDLDTDAQAVVEEKGYNVLYLALGFLEWRETSVAGMVHRAPMALVPVRLESLRQGREYQIVWNGDDVAANVSLQAKAREQSIEMPELNGPETAMELDEYYQSVERVVPDTWRILDLVELDFFSFAGFSLYHDLDPEAWSGTNHFESTDLLRCLLLNEPIPGNEGNGFDSDTIDEKLAAADMLHVVDADPSQIAVIEDAKAGRSLVVEGPPGTGKSQTIVNIIAGLLGQGRKVLFVSQKMAALDVVKQRLDGVGLGTACLELHSDKATKEHFVDQLRKVLENEATPHKTDAGDYARVDELRAQLGAYARALGAPVGAASLSPFGLFGLREMAVSKLGEAALSQGTEEFDGADAWTQEEINRLRQVVVVFSRYLAGMDSGRENPWRACEVGRLMPNDLPKVAQLLAEAKSSVEKARDAMVGLREWGIPDTNTFADAAAAIERAPELTEILTVEPAVGMNPEWHERPAAPEDLLNALRHVQAARLAGTFRCDEATTVADVDGAIAPYLRMCEAHGYYETFFQRIVRLFSREYRKVRASALALLAPDTPVHDRQALELLTRLRDGLKEKAWIVERAGTGRAFFGSAWKGEDSDPEQLERVAHSMQQLWQAVDEGRLTGNALAAVVRPVQERLSRVQDTERKLEDARSSLLSVYSRVGCGVNVNPVDGTSPDKLIQLLDTWIHGVDLLPSWSEYVAARARCRVALGESFVKTAESGQFPADELAPYFDVCTANSLLRKAFSERPALGSFSVASQEAAIDEYVRLDRRIIQLNQHRLAQLVEEGRPAILANPVNGSQAGLVRGEINRKRRHRPIRSLMQDAGSYIQALKPCFLMSPFSVAQFLDPSAVTFDCIVFDEASQVKPEEALGVLLRGRQLIVMGDTKQLPPTSFFDQMASGENTDDEDVADVPTADLESILHLCKNTLSDQCQKRLLWHYRSRHESLIAVSNREFYDNALRVYPSAVDNAPRLGLSFVYLPQGVYDRGRSRTNRVEAAEVARRVVEHYLEFPGQSLGVGTFNTEQQRAVEDELALLREDNPQLDQFFDRTNPEHCFVKNIESIQGDERDVILVSVGYGFDENHRFSQNFGPINQVGGERRLNVLMTRARIECIIFANFQAEMIPADGAAKGLSALRAFLQYAATRTFPATTGTSEEAESPFEGAVGAFLEENGFAVKRQVGCAQFRVDIGVVDPTTPGRYLCGVECDGASYHSARVARDRDRLRQQILEGLGWRIVRVWSTDWFLDRAHARERLLGEVRRLAEQDKGGGVWPTERGTRDPGSSQAASGHETGPNLSSQTSEFLTPVSAVAPPVTMRPRLTGSATGTPYIMCTSAQGVLQGVDLREASILAVASVVTEVVLTEGPVHSAEVLRRVRDLWGFQRAGVRIQEKVDRAIDYACSWGQIGQRVTRPLPECARLLDTFVTDPIARRGEFLWPVPARKVTPRSRDNASLARIELICDEEILAAIVQILESDYAAPVDGLVTGCSRILGIQAVHDQTRERIQNVIADAVRRKELFVVANGNIALGPPDLPPFRVET